MLLHAGILTFLPLLVAAIEPKQADNLTAPPTYTANFATPQYVETFDGASDLDVLIPRGPRFPVSNFILPTPTPTPQPFERPVPATPPKHQGRVGGHYACEDSDFKGHCEYYFEPPGKCHNYQFRYWNKYTAIKPDKSQICSFYELGDCYGDALSLKWPGTKNMRGKRFDNKVRSWNCWALD